MTNGNASSGSTPGPEEQASQQGAQTQTRVQVDERDVRTSYCNAFRTSETAEEVMMDFGLNIVRPSRQQQNQAEIIFQVRDRIVMNYYSAKRLTIALGQLIRRYEQQYGELELDVSKRRVDQSK